MSITPINTLASLNLKKPPQRVVSLVPSLTESLFELGVGAQVVGRTEYCIYPEAKVGRVPTIGGTKNADAQKIIALQPDLVLANQEENRPETIAALRAAGIPVWLTFPRTVRDAIDGLWDLTHLFNVPRVGQALSVLETAYEWASQAADNARLVRVFCPIWREPAQGEVNWWMTINRETYVHDVIRVCGGLNVFADRDRRYPLAADLNQTGSATEDDVLELDTRYPRLTPADLIAADPEVILLPSEPYPFTEADIATFDAYPEITAVKNQRIYCVDGSWLTWHGVRVSKALAELPQFLLPTAP